MCGFTGSRRVLVKRGLGSGTGKGKRSGGRRCDYGLRIKVKCPDVETIMCGSASSIGVKSVLYLFTKISIHCPFNAPFRIYTEMNLRTIELNSTSLVPASIARAVLVSRFLIDRSLASSNKRLCRRIFPRESLLREKP